MKQSTTDAGMAIFVIAVFLAIMFGVSNKAKAHDWYPPSCCGGNDCEPVKAWADDDGVWRFRYKDGKVYDVPATAMQPDETNAEPFQAHACVIPESADEGGGVVAPYVRCFWRNAAGG